MDDRQTKIRQGAGLEESRLNTDFLDFLNKWSSPVLIVIGLIGLGWMGWRYLERQKVAALDNAFAELNAAVSGGNPSPASLRNIAAEYDSVRSVGEIALLRTVDIYLRAAVLGVEPGAEVDPATGLPVQETDRLDEDRVRSYLTQAAELSRQVIGSTKDDAGKGLLHIHGWMRLAAAQEGLGSFEEAKSSYTNAAAAAVSAGFPELGVLAENRRQAVDALAGGVELPPQTALAPLPGEQPPAADPEPAEAATSEDGESAAPAGEEAAPADPAGTPAPAQPGVGDEPAP